MKGAPFQWSDIKFRLIQLLQVSLGRKRSSSLSKLQKLDQLVSRSQRLPPPYFGSAYLYLIDTLVLDYKYITIILNIYFFSIYFGVPDMPGTEVKSITPGHGLPFFLLFLWTAPLRLWVNTKRMMLSNVELRNGRTFFPNRFWDDNNVLSNNMFSIFF